MKLTREQRLTGELSKVQKLQWERDRERFQIEEKLPRQEQPDGKKLGDILAGILGKDESETEPLPKIIADRWPMVAGDQLAKHVTPSHLKHGILHLYADHPGWLAEIRRIPKAQLLKKISSIPNAPEIKDVRFQLDPAIRTFRK